MPIAQTINIQQLANSKGLETRQSSLGDIIHHLNYLGGPQNVRRMRGSIGHKWDDLAALGSLTYIFQ